MKLPFIIVGLFTFTIKIYNIYGLGINVATSQISDFVVNDDLWISWINKIQDTISPEIKYFWRDTTQLQKQYNAWKNKTSAIISIQNNELPLSMEQAFSILNIFNKYNHIIKAYTIGNELDSKLTPKEFKIKVWDSIQNLNHVMKEMNISIPITTPLSLSIFHWEEMILQNEWKETFLNLLQFYNETNSYIMFNIYPYLSWKNNKTKYTLQYSITTMFSDKIHKIEKILRSYHHYHLNLIIGETGWPTDDKLEYNEGANVQNAYKYFNIIKDIKDYDIYWFELIDEGKKPGTDDEHYYGLFKTNGVYKFT